VLEEGYCVNLKAVWNKKTLQPVEDQNGKKTYHIQMDPATPGTYVAFFVEMRFVNRNAFSFDTSHHWDPLLTEKQPRSEAERRKQNILKVREKLLGGKDLLPNFGGLDKDFGR
jgi:hypothetical protein